MAGIDAGLMSDNGPERLFGQSASSRLNVQDPILLASDAFQQIEEADG